ncbi:MAG: DUF1285 domain-containing protein [Aestuariivirgaceae bacterium]
MADQTIPIHGLNGIDRLADKALPPVHSWHPDTCRDIDMRIDCDGAWHYMGSPITRQRMVRLFSTILRRDDDERYYLVSPVEKCGITVDDVPFVVIDMQVSDRGPQQQLRFTTNVGDETTASTERPLRFVAGSAGEHIPYVFVRDRLEARIGRAVYYDLIDRGLVQRHEDADWFGVWSGGQFWPIALASDIGAEQTP